MPGVRSGFPFQTMAFSLAVLRFAKPCSIDVIRRNVTALFPVLPGEWHGCFLCFVLRLHRAGRSGLHPLMFIAKAAREAALKGCHYV